MDRGVYKNNDCKPPSLDCSWRSLSQVDCYHAILCKHTLIRWSQEEVGVPLGILTEGSIEKGNQDLKQTNSRFVARISMENIHRNTLHRLSWEVDPILHYESTVGQV